MSSTFVRFKAPYLVSSLSRGYQHISSNMAECVNSDFMKKAFKGFFKLYIFKMLIKQYLQSMVNDSHGEI